jgi:hypothetical protein
MAAWAEEQARPHAPLALPARTTGRLAAAGGGGTMLSNGAERVALPAGPGQAGRGLDA